MHWPFVFRQVTIAEHDDDRPATHGLFGLRSVLEWLDEHPEVGELNRMVVESLDNRELRDLEQREINVVGQWP